MTQKLILVGLFCLQFLALNPAFAEDSQSGKERLQMTFGFSILECREQRCGGSMKNEEIEIVLKPTESTSWLAGEYTAEQSYADQKLQAQIYVFKAEEKYSMSVSIKTDNSGLFNLLGGISFNHVKEMNSSFWLGRKIEKGEYTYLPLILINPTGSKEMDLQPYLHEAEKSLFGQ